MIEKKFEDESEIKKWGSLAIAKDGVAGVLTPENLNKLKLKGSSLDREI